MTMTSHTFRLERLPTPTGEMLVVTDEAGLLRAADWETHLERFQRLLGRHYGADITLTEKAGPPSKAAQALTAYFAGDLTAIDTIETATAGTDFQREVWAALRTIPKGETLSYGQLAARIGRDRAVRAVGLANGQNPVAIVVPCHRVIGANGSLTGYGGGMERKSWLLDHERSGR
jgi:methylated-DNA-[protein]-cysteine S-methyltransferase